MATLEQANDARSEHADALAKLGAHSVGVRQHQGSGSDDWVVIAYLAPDQQVKLPADLLTKQREKDVRVPLLVQRVEPFSPQ